MTIIKLINIILKTVLQREVLIYIYFLIICMKKKIVMLRRMEPQVADLDSWSKLF